LTNSLRDLPPIVQVSVVAEPYELLTPRSVVEEVRGVTLMDVATQAAGRGQRALKRALDVTVSLGLLVALTPAWIVAAIAVKMGSPGPVLFRQVRAGRHGCPFVIYKFRSMRSTTDCDRTDLIGRNEVDGPIFKIKDDPRTTKVGRFLRATSFDELPQLLNVLKGDMSLVGPRPFVCEEAEKIDGWAARRFEVRPGMTGLWQVSGRNDLPFEELRRLDYVYVASWSLWWDMKILWQTPGSVTTRLGAY
jgi:lipopolysaccharide/colanic/teichoic acid biosynthesis glycosyltransferase